MGIISGVATWWETFTAPDDGKLRNASNILVSLRALADRTRYLKDQLPGVVNVSAYSYDSSSVLVQNLTDDGSYYEAEGEGLLVDLADCRMSDVVFATFTSDLSANAGSWPAADARVRLYFKLDHGGSSEVKVPWSGATRHLRFSGGTRVPIAISSPPQIVTVPGTVRVGVETSVPSGGLGLGLLGGIVLRVVRLRGVNFPI